MALHEFRPDHYHMTLGSHAPVLRISDGDSVATTTIDAFGCDAGGQQVMVGPNPQTGPFFIEGAEPGDTLAVHLDKIWPNRDYGISGNRVAPHVVDPSYVTKLPEFALAQWTVDGEAGTATLLAPKTNLGPLNLPLSPMLGCFGVAPADGEAISTVTSACHGGNMDYKRFVAGTTIYFPVFVPGALFFLGDGHAVQGCGEIVGSGIEISMDVRFTVRLMKGRRINWPRVENDTHIMTIGNARPLDQAVQHATTEMILWLQDEYGLDPVGVQTMLGQCVEYEVGNFFDPAYTMVCKLSKAILGQITKGDGAHGLPTV